MSWIAEYDTQGREFPTCVHVTKTTGTMTHGVTYVPIEDGKAVRAENAKLRELVRDVYKAAHMLCEAWDGSCSKEADGMSLHSVCPIGDTSELCVFGKLDDRMRELGVTE